MMNYPQTETAAELDALLPAILDRAFRGKLRRALPFTSAFSLQPSVVCLPAILDRAFKSEL
jgi:hypothetical protein